MSAWRGEVNRDLCSKMLTAGEEKGPELRTVRTGGQVLVTLSRAWADISDIRLSWLCLESENAVMK